VIVNSGSPSKFHDDRDILTGPSAAATVAGVFAISAPPDPTSYCDTLSLLSLVT